MFESSLEVVLQALMPRLALKKEWRVSDVSLHKLISARRLQTDVVGVFRKPSSDEEADHNGNIHDGKGAAEAISRGVEMSLDSLAPALDRENRVKRLRELEERVSRCAVCPELARSRKQPVSGAGDVEAALLFVEETPLMEQDFAGRVNVGEASELLDKMLKAMGLSRGDVFTVHFLRCRPPQSPEDSKPRRASIDELNSCRSHMEELVKIIQPKVIVALGAGAARGLCETQAPVARLRSHWHQFKGIPVMPTFHPSYLIENPETSNKRKVWEDLLMVMEKVNMPISSKQRAYFLR